MTLNVTFAAWLELRPAAILEKMYLLSLESHLICYESTCLEQLFMIMVFGFSVVFLDRGSMAKRGRFFVCEKSPLKWTPIPEVFSSYAFVASKLSFEFGILFL